MRLLILFAAVLLAGCKREALKVDPCVVQPGKQECFAVPINQPEKPEYLRAIKDGTEDDDGDGKVDADPDVCVRASEYARIQKYERELEKMCR